MRTGGAGLVLAVALAVSGCSDESSSGEPLPPVSPTVTSASPSASAIAFPATPQGASDFARYVFEQIEKAYDESDPEVVRPLFASAGCDACARYLSTLERLASGAVTVERSGNSVLSAESPGDPGPTIVVVRIAAGGAIFRDDAGLVVGEEPAGERTVEAELQRAGDQWRLAEVVIVQ